MDVQIRAAKRWGRLAVRQPYRLVYRLFRGPDPIRKLGGKGRSLPDFLIIGGMRCGSTSLYQYVVGHHQVSPSVVKEIHFFDKYFEKGLLWYRAHFPRSIGQKHGCITGEASVHYLLYPLAAKRASQVVPHAKVIVILRDPAKRAYSHYWHQVRRGREHLSFEEAIAAESERIGQERFKFNREDTSAGYNYHHFSYLRRGVYVEQLESWLRYFPREQILVLIGETFFRTLDVGLRAVWSFLGLEEPLDWPAKTAKKYNRTVYPPMSTATHRQLESYFGPHNKRLEELFGVETNWS